MVTKRKEIYKANKLKKVGEECTCPICEKSFVKKQWQQAFCCGSCKDRFWNEKADRHKKGYYRKYNLAHPERLYRIGKTDDDILEILGCGDDPFSCEGLGQW